MKTDKQLQELAAEILALPNPVVVIAGLLKELELLRLDREPPISNIPVGELW